MVERTRALKEFPLHFRLQADEKEEYEIRKAVEKIPFTIQASDDLELGVEANDCPTFFYNTNKIVSISPDKGEIQAFYHGTPMLIRSEWLDYKFLWSSPKEVVILCNDFDREIHVKYSK